MLQNSHKLHFYQFFRERMKKRMVLAMVGAALFSAIFLSVSLVSSLVWLMNIYFCVRFVWLFVLYRRVACGTNNYREYGKLDYISPFCVSCRRKVSWHYIPFSLKRENNFFANALSSFLYCVALILCELVWGNK